MLSLAEIGSAVYGAWRLAWFDPNGMRFFDRSIEGFWRSFRVALLAAPVSALLIGLDLSTMKVGGGWFRVLVGESIAYVIGWVAFPLLAYYLTEAIDRRAQYLGFIVAYNWSTVVQLGLFLPAVLIDHSHILPNGLGLSLTYAASIAVLVYEWFIVRTALALPGFGAAGVVLVDFVISALVHSTGDFIAQAS